MQVSKVIIQKTFASEPVKAVASVEIGGYVTLNDILIVKTHKGHEVRLPTKKNKNGTIHYIATINYPFLTDFTAEVLNAYYDFIGRFKRNDENK